MRGPTQHSAIGTALLTLAWLGCDGPAGQAQDAHAIEDGHAGDADADVNAIEDGPAGDVNADEDGPAGATDADGDARAEVAIGDGSAGQVDSAAGVLLGCQGATVPLSLAHDLPYVRVGVGGATGWFLVDWGTTASAIDARGFVPYPPEPAAGTSNRWNDFIFFGPWATVTLWPQDFSAFADPVRQAGILGTDFLSLDAFVVDWEASTLARADGDGCSDAALSAAGMRPLSTRGYFARELDALLPGVPNIPTIPVRVGAASAPAQIDTGYDDALVGPAINVNGAFRALIPDASLRRAAELDLVLTTCVPGLVEAVEAWRLAPGLALELVGTDGQAVRRFPDAIVFVKNTPAGARQCGGIGTWSSPGAQLGVSFIARGGRALFDPVSSRVWLVAD